MITTEIQVKTSRRQLAIHDSFAFLILLAVTLVLFAFTLLLFRSFSAHRADIARDAGEDGRIALRQGRPHDAIDDLRTALSYAPNQRDYELLLAQALGEDGHLDEATSYFLNLWDSQPGDGFINLQLARLERQHHRVQPAINYYRAAIFGSWNGDGVVRRRDTRLELANYLIDQKQFALAKSELLVASSNAPVIRGFSVSLGDMLLRANDPSDALKEYQKGILEDPLDAIAYEKAGRIAYTMGNYSQSRDWLEKALRESAGAVSNAAEPEGDISSMLKNAERLLVLDPGLASSRTERVSRILEERTIAKKRFDACRQQTAIPQASLASLTARWMPSNLAASAPRTALLRDDSNEDLVRSLINDTETITAHVCGAPQGDDALLLMLAQRNLNQ